MAERSMTVAPTTILSIVVHFSYVTAGLGAGEFERERVARDSGRDLLLALVTVSNLS